MLMETILRLYHANSESVVMAFCANCGKELPPSAVFCQSCGASVSQAVGSARPTLSGMDSLINEGRTQGYWFRRLIAFVIDVILVDVVLGILALAFAIPAFLVGGVAAVISLFAGVFSIVSGVVLVIYFAVLEAASSASIGKHILGLRVTTTGGQKPNFGEAFVRNLSKIYWILLLLDVIVGLATSKKYSQKFSDRLVGTEVVSSEAAPPG